MADEKQVRLTNRQRLFVEEYLVCWNATEAARRAGYRGDANTVGPRLLVNVGVKRLIEQRLKEKAMSADEVLARLSEQAQVSLADFIKQYKLTLPAARKGEKELVILSGDLDWEAIRRRGHLVKKISFNMYGPVIELHDAQAALIQLGKYHKLFTEQVEHSGTVDLGGTVDKALKKIYGDNSDSGT